MTLASGRMRDALRRLLDETWILILGCGLVLGYTSIDLVQAIGGAIAGAFETSNDGGVFAGEDSVYAFHLGSHEINLARVVPSLITFLLALAAVAVVVTLVQRHEDESPDVD
jgi:hypothetical protein